MKRVNCQRRMQGAELIRFNTQGLQGRHMIAQGKQFAAHLCDIYDNSQSPAWATYIYCGFGIGDQWVGGNKFVNFSL